MQPTVAAFQAAASNADWAKAPGYYVILTDQPGEASWPITAATFILMHKDATDKAASQEAIKFFKWAFEKGDKMAEELDYIPMPDTGRQADREDLVGRHQELRHASRPQRALPQAGEGGSNGSGVRKRVRNGRASSGLHGRNSRRRPVEQPTGQANSTRDVVSKYRGLAWQTWPFRAT